MGEGKKMRELEEMVEAINALEPEVSAFSDADLASKTPEFRARLEEGETLDDLLAEAFAVCREAAKRTLGMRHFDVQIIGGIVLHQGKIAEMRTGEGKTLVATLPVYLNALAGQGVHVVTVNDYLAKRDAEWMGRIYRFLGLQVASLEQNQDPWTRKPLYDADVTYGTNSEFGFDYLRDNMAADMSQRVQRGYHFAIVDEVDSILIDEARTPLIISGPAEKAADVYYAFARIVPKLTAGVDFEVDEKHRTVAVTESGVEKVERELGVDNLYDNVNSQLINHLNQALKAHGLFKKDVDYVVKDGEVLIVDEFTGRMLVGRRYSEGLHQAIEAKERVKIQEENQTLATITLQNYFRMYEKLAGMTGTAATEAGEFEHIYKLETVIVPTNMPMVRDDMADLVYKTEQAKFDEVIADISDCHDRGQPVLVGTISIEKNEHLGHLLKRRGIPHEILNAKQHEREAHIIAQAGRLGAVTIATNMAGRGVDIMLGGNPESLAEELLKERGVKPEEASDEQLQKALADAKQMCAAEHEQVVGAGGLHVLGTERHESRRIDNQLRGRSGRQGDPGSSRFYLSLEDDLMRLFGSERIGRLMERMDWPEDMPIEHGMVTKSIETAQRQVESQNFEIRKHVLEYDDVMNLQREVIYAQRNEILEGQDIHGKTEEMMTELFEAAVDEFCPEKVYPEEWDWDGLAAFVSQIVPMEIDLAEEARAEMDRHSLAEELVKAAMTIYADREEHFGPELMRDLERQVMLQVIDNRWREHLYEMDYLREGIGLRAVGQKDPLVEYKSEAYAMFMGLVAAIKQDYLTYMFHVEVVREQPGPVPLEGGRTGGGAARSHKGKGGKSAKHGAGREPKAALATAAVGPVGRNDPCPCGSGKKYKKCCGA
jgi:preprotein translocase subunit SecA